MVFLSRWLLFIVSSPYPLSFHCSYMFLIFHVLWSTPHQGSSVCIWWYPILPLNSLNDSLISQGYPLFPIIFGRIKIHLQDYFWTFCSQFWKNKKVSVSAANVVSEAHCAAKAYVDHLHKSGVLESEAKK